MSAFDTQTACFAEQRCINSGACGMDGGRGAYMVLVGKPEGTKPLGRPRRRWKDNIKKYLQEVGCLSVDWLRRGQVVGTCDCGNEPSGSI